MSNPFGGGPPPGGGGFGTPPPGGGYGGPPPGGGFGQPPGGPPPFGQPPPGGGGFGQPPGGPPGFGQPPGGPPAFGQPAGGPPGFGAPIAQARTAVPFNNAPAMFLGIAVAMFCGCVPGGILAIFLAHQAKQQAERGDLDGANGKLRMSYVVSAVSMALLVLAMCLYVGLMVVAGA